MARSPLYARSDETPQPLIRGLSRLLPALQVAREQARKVQCINNLHQIWMGFMLYGERLANFGVWFWNAVVLGILLYQDLKAGTPPPPPASPPSMAASRVGS